MTLFLSVNIYREKNKARCSRTVQEVKSRSARV